VAGNVINSRNRSLFKENVVDLGLGNIGVVQLASKITTANSWTAAPLYKDRTGVVTIMGAFNSGTTTTLDVMGTLPVGAWPYIAPDVVRRNLMTYSQMLDNTGVWTSSSLTSFGSTTAVTSPFGAGSVNKVIANVSDAAHGRNQTVAVVAGDVVVSIYAKSAEYTKLAIVEYGGGLGSARFDLAIGSVIATSGTGTPTSGIVGVGGGWYRCWVKFTKASNGNVGFGVVGYPDTGVTFTAFTTTYAGDTTSGVYLWGAQVENAAAISSYQRVEAATDGFFTMFSSRLYPVMTDGGVGTVSISSTGVIAVGTLPSNVNVFIPPFQGARVE
jgi:hypothetical protein